MIPLASFFARYLGKRVSKVTVQAMDMAAVLNTHLMEIFRNHKLIKVFQKETYETSRANNALEELKNKGKKLAIIYARSSPIMEFLTGIMIAILIYYSGNLIAMPQPLYEDGIEYLDGTKATSLQMARDVTTFLAWASEPELEERKKLGVTVILFLIVLSILSYFSMRQIWAPLKKQNQ